MSYCDSESEKRSSTPEYKKFKRGESSKKLTHRKQKYRVEWEQDSKFKGWITNTNGKLLQVIFDFYI